MDNDRKDRTRHHFNERLLDRYGIVCTDSVYNDFLDQIHYFRARLIKYKTPTNAIYELRYKGRSVYVAHEKELGTSDRGVLVTALEEFMLIRNGGLDVQG